MKYICFFHKKAKMNYEYKNMMDTYDVSLDKFRRDGVSAFRAHIKNFDIFSIFNTNLLENMFRIILQCKFSCYRDDDMDDIIDEFLAHHVSLKSFVVPHTMRMEDLKYLERKGITTREKFDALLGCGCENCSVTDDAELNKYIRHRGLL